MRPFNIEEYLKNPNKKVITRNFHNVRVLCINRKDNYPIVALVDYGSKEELVCYNINGEYFTGSKSSLNLFFAKEKKEGWINLYKDGNKTGIGNVYPLESEELAKEAMSDKDYIATCKIEWEE